MSNKLQQLLQLLPVRTVPFFAAGIILCACGGAAATILMLTASITVMLALRFRKTLFASAMALLLGMALVTLYIQLVSIPLRSYDGTVQHLTLNITEEYKNTGYSYYKCNTMIGGRPASLHFYAEKDLTVGDVVDADVRLSEIPSERSLARQYILSASIKEVHEINSPQFSLRRSISEYRSRLQSDIYAHIGGDAGALAQGLLFGNTSDFSAELYHASKISGVVHLTAVSGSHFVIIVSVMLELAGRNKRLRSLLALILIPMTVMFFGSEPTVLRAGIMIFLCNCGPLLSRKSESLNSLCVAVFVMTVFTPYVMLDIGFQMSVLGVFGVTVLGPRLALILRRYTRKLHEMLRGLVDAMSFSACAVVCIAPISAVAFGGVSLAGVFATLVLAPIFTAVLTIAVIYAMIGLSPLLFPLELLIHIAYHIIMMFGSSDLLWLPMDFAAAGLLALVAALALTVAIIFYDERRDLARSVFVLSILLSLGLCLISGLSRRKIEFASNGTSGAAIVCIKSDAAILICGNGSGMTGDIADQLLRNGTRTIRHITANELDENGANALITLGKLYPIESISADDSIAAVLSAGLPDTEVLIRNSETVTIDGISINCAKSGDTSVTADIVMYYGYKLSEPAHNAGIPIYVSSRQDILPENGINIYDTQYEIKLKEPKK